MQIAETLNEGLKRAFTLTIAASDIEALVEAEVKKVAPQVRMSGFRPGKVPANLIRKMHGSALRQDALNTAIQNGVTKIVGDNKFRPAMQPSVELGDDYEPGTDAQVKVALEILPDVPAPVIGGLKLERLTIEVDDGAVSEQLAKLAAQQKSYGDASEGYQAKSGDLVVMDFLGKVEGVPFDGGTGEDMSIELGSGRLIPGFEEQLIGVKAGDTKTIDLDFPKDYGVANLQGKAATFDLTIKDVRIVKDTAIDEDFAKSLGLESLEQLRGLLKGQIEQEHNGLTRTHMKRKLLDQLAESHDFPVPPSMVDAEFGQIWQQLDHEASHEDDPAAARAEMENDRDDYRKIAERRVRLGLLLSEIGQANGIEVTQQEMNMLVQQAAQQYNAKDRERFVQYLQAEPMAAAQLRAPLYEDKVVDFLFSKSEITDRASTRAELEAEIEADADGHVHGPDCGHDHDHDHAKPVKKAKGSKPAASKAGTEVPMKTAKKKDASIAEVITDVEPVIEAPLKKAAMKKALSATEAVIEDAAPAQKSAAKKAKKTEA